MDKDLEELQRRAGIVNEGMEAARAHLEEQFWARIDSSSRNGYTKAIDTLLRLVPIGVLEQYIAQKTDADEGY